MYQLGDEYILTRIKELIKAELILQSSQIRYSHHEFSLLETADVLQIEGIKHNCFMFFKEKRYSGSYKYWIEHLEKRDISLQTQLELKVILFKGFGKWKYNKDETKKIKDDLESYDLGKYGIVL